MVDLSSYQIIEQIHKGDHSVIYRARRLRDDVPVIIKRHRTDYPSAADLTRYSREVQIGQQLEGQGIIKYYGLEKFRHSLAVITEDIGGTALKNVIPATGMEILTFLDIAVELTEALREIHQQNVIHKDNNSRNIMVATPPDRSPDNP